LKGQFTLNDCYKILLSDFADPFTHFVNFLDFECEMVEGEEIDMF
jgi:hypothetical protein